MGYGRALIVTLSLEPMPRERGERFAVAPGMPDANDILLDARSEDPLDRRLDPVMVRVSDKSFDGQSYGLALAIADQRARSGYVADRPLIATGVVSFGGRGAVAEVESFEAKLDLILNHVRSASEAFDLAVPEGNWQAASLPSVRSLRALEETGRLRIHAGSHVRDFAPLWRREADRPRRPRAPVFLTAAAGIALLAAGIGAWQWLPPVLARRACQDSVGGLGEKSAPEAVGKALRACSRAVDLAPDDGRMHFLLGQTHALNNSELLAKEAWRTAARLGDPDGMAAYGRALWLSRPADPAVVKEALRWLERAANAGSVAAAEDIGYVLIDGQAMPADPKRAQSWFDKARTARRRSGGE